MKSLLNDEVARLEIRQAVYEYMLAQRVEPPYCTFELFSSITGLSLSAVRSMATKGQVPVYRNPAGGRIMINLLKLKDELFQES